MTTPLATTLASGLSSFETEHIESQSGESKLHMAYEQTNELSTSTLQELPANMPLPCLRNWIRWHRRFAVSREHGLRAHQVASPRRMHRASRSAEPHDTNCSARVLIRRERESQARGVISNTNMKGSNGLKTASIGNLLKPHATYKQTPTGGVNKDIETFAATKIPI